MTMLVDVDEHVAFRMGRFARDPVRFVPELAESNAAWGPYKTPKRMCALTTRPPARLFSLNSFDRLVAWKNGRFEAISTKAEARRPTYFGNELLKLGPPADYLLNPCDAQGWDYHDLWPALQDTPVFQYCRTPSQRDQVALVPLDDRYMGPGSPNVPAAGYDSIPFRRKHTKMVWRGRMSGTIQHRKRIEWVEGEFRRAICQQEALRSDQIESILRYPRPSIVRQLAEVPWADVGMVILPAERKMLADRKLSPDLAPLFCNPLPRDQQLLSKYLLCIDGNDIPTGFYWALQSNSLVFRLGGEWETALDFGLKPWEHFIPVAKDGSDIEELFERCEADPAMCEEIIENAHRALTWVADAAARGVIDRAVLKRYARAQDKGN